MNRGHRNCEICGVQESRCSDKAFFARFPAREQICKQWVKVVGKEDLVYLPIHKLHDLRYVCGRHFEKRQFTKTKTRLKKNAVPTLQLPEPLRDELLEGFPFHKAGKNQGSCELEHQSTIKCIRKIVPVRKKRVINTGVLISPSILLRLEHDYCISTVDGGTSEQGSVDVILHTFPNPITQPERFRTWVQAVGGELWTLDDQKIYKYRRICHDHFETRYHTWTKRLTIDAVPTLYHLGFHANDNGGVSTVTASTSTMTVPVYAAVEGKQNIPPKPKTDPIIPPVKTSTPADYVSSEHAYNRQKHEDHNYTKTPFSATNESPAEKILSGEDSKKNYPCPRQDRPATDADNGFKSSIDLESNNTRGEPNNIEYGIDLNSLDGFDEPTTEAIFSWQKEDILYPAEDTDVLMCPEPAKGDKLRQLLEDICLYDDYPPLPSQAHDKTQKQADAEYQCNVCEKEIIGFRYTCVQCADFDLCGACEANGAHNTHYVLRVPKDRPYNEIQTVMAAIRQQLLAENLFLTEQLIEDCVKSEPEEEPAGAEGGGERAPELAPAAELDPLRRPSPDRARASTPVRSDDEYSDGSVYKPPRRKRRRRRSPNSNSDTDSDSSDTTHTETPLHHKARTKPATRSALNPVHGTQLVTNPEDRQPDVLEISGAVYQLPDDIFAVPGTVFEVPGNIYELPASMAADGVLEVPDNITVFRKEPSKVITERIYVEEDVVQDNLEEDNEILHLRVPSDTDDAALSQALHSQAYVAMKPLVIRTAKR